MEIELNTRFLETLLQAVGPSGFEQAAAKVWRAEAEGFADRVWGDAAGNTYAQLNPGGSPRLMLAGHVDEIGVIVTHIDENGLVYLAGLGGWDPEVLVGQRVRFLGRSGQVLGVVGKKAIHLQKKEDREKAVRLEDLWVDIGTDSREATLERLEVGSVGVIDQPPRYLDGRRLVSRAIDDRIGAFVVLEALRHLAARGVEAEVTAVATVQEEMSFAGAMTSAFHLRPEQAIVVDVTHCTRQPGVEKKKAGQAELGKGADLSVGPYVHPELFARLRALAEAQGIPYTVSAHAARTATDADAVALSREGVPTAVISVPNRYMHSPSEMIDLGDVEAVVSLIVAYASSARPIAGR